MHLTAVSALAGSAIVSTFSATAAFSVCGYGGGLHAPSKVLPASAVSRLGRSHSARTRAGVHAGLRMGFLDNMFKPAVSEEDPLWMQRDFKVAGRKDGSWEAYTDDASGEIYYYNSATQETLWEAEYLAAYPPEPEPEPEPAVQQVPKTETVMRGSPFANPFGRGRGGAAAKGVTGRGANTAASAKLDASKFNIKWRANGGTQMKSGGFGYVYLGTYDARENPDAARNDVKVVVKLPTEDPDAVAAFNSEGAINQKIASCGGMAGVAEFMGTVDLAPVAAQLPPGIGANYGLVFKQVQGKTLDTFFDRGGGMSPVLANTLNVRNSPPVKISLMLQGQRNEQLAYIKTDLCKRVMGEALLPLVQLHEQGIIHRDMKPQNIMLVENDQVSPFRVIDFGSAIFQGQNILMDDYTEIYAPPEAPTPDSRRPDAYDIYTIGIIGLRCLMPSLVAGEAGVQTFGKVTCAEFPANNYDFRAWAQGRINNPSPTYNDIPIMAEVKGLTYNEPLYNLMADMLDRDPSKRPTAKQCLERLGEEWVARDKAMQFNIGEVIPGDWQEGVQYSLGGSFEPGETVIVRRSDGSLKFGVVKTLGGRGTVDVTVEASGNYQRGVDTSILGKIAM